MELIVKDINKNSSASVEVADFLLQEEFNETLVHQLVVAYLAKKRSGTKAQKSRADVSGGGRKPWKQKGTGRARAGSIRSPLWRHGGKIFAAVPRNYAQKVNKKMYKKGMNSIISELNRQQRLVVVESLSDLIVEPKTKNILALLKNKFDVSVNDKILFVDENIDNNLYLAGRNLPSVAYTDLCYLNPVHLINADKIIISLRAVRKLEEKAA